MFKYNYYLCNHYTNNNYTYRLKCFYVFLCVYLHTLFKKSQCCLYYIWQNSNLLNMHHCVVIFFWSSGIMECTCMLFTFENGVLLMRKGASVVWHYSLPLMNSFNKTEAAVFSCRLCFLRAFPIISLIEKWRWRWQNKYIDYVIND